jgi:hypothetical protein
MKLKFVLIYALMLFASAGLHAQGGRIEFYVIDSYVTPETPHTFKLTFLTSDSCTTEIFFNNEKTLDITRKLSDNHKFTLDLTGYVFDSTSVPFVLIAKDKFGNLFKSEQYEVELPDDKSLLQAEGGGSVFNICLGGISLLFPSVGVYFTSTNSLKFSLSKEIPFLMFNNIGAKYPSGYLALSYSYVFNNDSKNFLGVFYKKIFETNLIEYIALGGGIYTDFKGAYGFSPELEFGLFRIYNDYTLFLQYKFNLNISDYSKKANQIYLGLYAPFFSLNY